MLNKSVVSFVGLVASVAIGASPALADVTLKSHMTIDSPQLRAQMANIPAQYRSMVAKFTDMINTIAVSGKKMRMDMPMISIITDSDADKTIQLYTFNKTFYVTKFDPTISSQLLSGPAGRSTSSATPSDWVVTDTGKTSTMIGHSVHEYIITSKTKGDDGTVTTMKADIWAAADVGGADSGGLAALLPPASGKTQVNGVPLSTTTTFTGGSEDGTSVKSVVTSISTDPIPSTTFAPPSDYTKTDSPAMPSAADMNASPGTSATQ